MKWLSRLVLALALTAPGTWPSFGQSVGGTPYVTPTIPFVVASGCNTTPILLTTTGAGTWTNNTGCTAFAVQMIGAGGKGGVGSTNAFSAGGGGGQYASIGLTIALGATVGYNVPPGTNSGNGGDAWWCSTTTLCTSRSDTNVVLCAQGGAQGASNASASAGGGAGGSACTFGTTFAGGRGGNLTFGAGATFAASGGGGAGGQFAAGGNGVDSTPAVNTATNGGQGDGTHGGAGGTGVNGGQGGAGGAGSDGSGCSWGSGGGGGGQNVGSSTGANHGGTYGGGGGGWADAIAGSTALSGQGAICIQPINYTGPGDVTAFSDWYGLRAYSGAIAAAATQKAVNLRNTGTNETCDVLVSTSGGLASTVSNCSGASSGTAVATFCTGGCASPKIYDQAGGGVDASQAVAADQMTINLSCVGSLPCLQSAGAGRFAGTVTTTAQPNSATAVGARTGNFTTQQTLFGGSGAVNEEIIFFTTSTNTGAIYAGTTLSATATNTSNHTFQAVFNNTACVYSVDGTETSGTCNTEGWTSSNFIGADSVGDILTGNFMEAGVKLGSAWASGTRNSLCHNERLYWSTGGSC